MRTAWPVSSRALGCVRFPFTRTSPLRMMRWMWLNDSPGKRASKKRSTRMLFSSGVTVTVCTPAEENVAFAATAGSEPKALPCWGPSCDSEHFETPPHPDPRLAREERESRAWAHVLGARRIGAARNAFSNAPYGARRDRGRDRGHAKRFSRRRGAGASRCVPASCPAPGCRSATMRLSSPTTGCDDQKNITRVFGMNEIFLPNSVSPRKWMVTG